MSTQTSTQPTTIVRPTNSLSGWKSQTISLNQQKVDKPIVKTTVKLSDAKDVFSQEQLVEVWNEFAEIIKSKGKYSFSSSMLKGNPTLESDGFTILYHIYNATEEVEFTEMKADIMEFLRKKLNNFAIQILLNMEKPDMKKTVYLPQDKYNVLTQRNPNLPYFTQKIGLDLGY